MQNQGRILVVDNEPAMQLLLRLSLQKRGYTVQTAGTGQEVSESERDEPEEEVRSEQAEPEEVPTMNCFNCRFCHVDRKRRDQFYCMALEEVHQESDDMPCGGELYKEDKPGECPCCGQAV